jgi:ribonuclease P protein component
LPGAGPKVEAPLRYSQEKHRHFLGNEVRPVVSGRIPAPLYRKVYDEGRSAGNRYLVIYYLPEEVGIRFGVSAGKRLGKAVVRNKLKRRVKEAFRRFLPKIGKGGQVVFIVRRSAVSGTYADIENAVKDLLNRMELLENANG